jgi:hypothetical protein
MKVDLPDVSDLIDGDTSISLHDDGKTVLVVEVSKWESRSAASEYVDCIKMESNGLLNATFH